MKKQDETKQIQLSKYHQFMMDSAGYKFYDKKSDNYVDKWEIYVTFENDIVSLSKVIKGTHSRYIMLMNPESDHWKKEATKSK